MRKWKQKALALGVLRFESAFGRGHVGERIRIEFGVFQLIRFARSGISVAVSMKQTDFQFFKERTEGVRLERPSHVVRGEEAACREGSPVWKAASTPFLALD